MLTNKSEDNSVDFLYLSEEDLIEAGALDMEKCVGVIDDMFKVMGTGDYLMGGPNENSHGLKIFFPKKSPFENMPTMGPDRRFMSLIAYLGGDFNVAGEKWYGSNIENSKKGLPRSILTITLNNVDTGQPLAFMSGNLISAMRTGAVPGVAAKYLALPDSETLAVVGGGVINWACVLAILETNKNLSKVKVFDISQENAQEFCDRLEKENSNIKATPAASMQECIENSDIITVATSGSAQPEIKEEWLKEGSLLTLTGSAKISDDFYLNNRVVSDNWKMHEVTGNDNSEWEQYQAEAGNESAEPNLGIGGKVYKLVQENKLAKEAITDLGDIASGTAEGRRNDKEKIVLITGGMPTEDVAWAHYLYEEAKKNDIGQVLKLWDTPYWR